jgi:CHAT domain-containing protein
MNRLIITSFFLFFFQFHFYAQNTDFNNDLVDTTENILFYDSLSTLFDLYEKDDEGGGRVIDLINSVNNHYFKVGDFTKSLQFNLRSYELSKQNYKIWPRVYIRSLYALGTSYNHLGDYTKTIQLSNEAIDILNSEHKKFKETTPDSITPYWMLFDFILVNNNLAATYSSLNQEPKALEIYLKSLRISEIIDGKNSLSYSLILHNVVTMKMQIDTFDVSCIDDYREIIRIKKEIYPKDTARIYNQVAQLGIIFFDHMEQYELGVKYILRALTLCESFFNSKYTPSYLRILDHLSYNYTQLDSFERAIEVSLEALEIAREYYSPMHPDLAIKYFVLHDLYARNNKDKACDYLLEVQELDMSRYKLYENTLNNSLSATLYNRLWDNFMMIFDYTIKLDKKEQIKNQYNILCFLKGRELSKNNAISSNIYKSKNDELIKLYQDWIDINKQIVESFEMTLEDEQKLDVSKLQDDADRLERQLTKRSTVFASNQSNYSFDDIVSNLKHNEVYLDIINVETYNYNKNWFYNSSRYYAYVIQKGYTTPRLVDLGSSSDFDSTYNYYFQYTQDGPYWEDFTYEDEIYGNICYKNFWSKLDPYLEGVSTVYFSPDGVYSKINPNVLYDSTSSSFLIDKYDIVYVSNVENFVHQKENIQIYERPDDLHAVLIGNPTFLLGDDEVVLATNEDRSRSINQDELDSLQRGLSLSQLPATQTEIDLISSNLKSKGWDVEVISGIDATEKRVKSIESPKILHIATHGFFFEDQGRIKRTNMISADNKKAFNNPMTRSGLIFSGAENTMNGEILSDDNGWLNSYEASLLNLRGTELVVLSACQTGAGDIQNGKGVYGLQRAIRVSGAESLIMSMWKVNDKATQELMNYFYDYWIDKKTSKKEAFKQAQRKIREKYKHPYYWGAFIMLGK